MRNLIRWLLASAAVGAAIGYGVNALHAQSPGVGSNFPITWTMEYASPQRTYSSQIVQLSLTNGVITDVWQICGAAGKVTKIRQITLNGRSTAVQPIDVTLIKRSNWDTGGTVASNQAPFGGALSALGVPYDSTASAGGAAVTPYVANPTVLGTLVGNLTTAQHYLGNLTTGINVGPLVFDFGLGPDGEPTLRSATECLALNLSPSVVPGGLLDIGTRWTEE